MLSLRSLPVIAAAALLLTACHEIHFEPRTGRGEILIYASSGKLEDTISVGEHVDSIRVGPKDDVLLLTSGKEKRVQIVTLDFIKEIGISDSPFKGNADAQVVIAVFDDFQ